MDDIRVLCFFCKQDYIKAGYKIEWVLDQHYTQPCDKCGRPGYEQKITPPPKEQR